MAVLRQWLDEAGFDWEEGRLILWPGQSCGSLGGEVADSTRPVVALAWAIGRLEAVPCVATSVETKDHADLDEEFDDGFGGYGCPSFVAFSDGFIFLASQYDGRTGLVKISMSPDSYLNGEGAPCPGGG